MRISTSQNYGEPMSKKIIIGIMLVLVTNLVFAGWLKKGVSVSGPKKPEGAQGVVTQKASLQSCKPNPFKLSENEIRRLTESAENGDGYACWKLAVYSYLNEKMEIKRLTGIGICLILTKNNKI